MQKIGLTSFKIGHKLEEAVKNKRELVYLSLKKPGREQYRGVIHEFFSDFGIYEDCHSTYKNPKPILGNYISAKVSIAVSTAMKKHNEEEYAVILCEMHRILKKNLSP